MEHAQHPQTTHTWATQAGGSKAYLKEQAFIEIF